MRCFSCNKNFDYDKYYGICPKCGCYNKPEASKQHQEYHDLYDDGYTHSEEHYNTYTEFKEETKQRPSVFARELEQEAKPKTRSSGSGLLISSIVFFVVSLLITIIVFIASFSVKPQPDVQIQERVIQEKEIGECFFLQELELYVSECRVLADWTTQGNLEKGKKLIAVCVNGSSDGEYEDYNRLASPYLEIDGSFYRPLYAYDFEPYAQFYEIMPLWDESSLMFDESFSGWYAFLVDEACEYAKLTFEDCVWDDWEKEDVLNLYSVNLYPEGGMNDEES